MDKARVGFVGFGEVGAALAQRTLEHGAEVLAYDIRLEEENGRRELQARNPGVRFAPLPAVISDSAYVLAAVPTQACRAVAAQAASYLRAGHVYVDLATIRPSLKREIAGLISSTGAAFVEGAILDAVGVAGATAVILLGGARGREAAEFLYRMGLNARFYSTEIGRASAFQLLRSIFSRGAEALVLEMLIAAARAGLTQSLWDDVTAFLDRNRFETVAGDWVRTHPAACERRYWELVEVRETLRELGLDPVMTRAAESFFERSRWLGLRQAFPAKPETVEPVVQLMMRRLTGSEDACK
ncbi:MAG: NAD(P)-binding domain-containing protein [Bryobacterales bacterium]|nr:NAD(P)-binding domain-containing protein [Bryobacteraceae bacterium]MDW8354118.1 NAD(P)-binding domain-containing protein [Bryobacterales bacterium]